MKRFLCVLFITVVLGFLGYVAYIDFAPASASVAKENKATENDSSAELPRESEESVLQKIEKYQEEYDFSLSEEDAKVIVETVEQLEAMGISSDQIIAEARKLYEKYGQDSVNHVEEAIANLMKDGITSVSEEISESIKNTITDSLNDLLKFVK